MLNPTVKDSPWGGKQSEKSTKDLHEKGVTVSIEPHPPPKQEVFKSDTKKDILTWPEFISSKRSVDTLLEIVLPDS